MLLRTIVDATEIVTATSSRLAKIDALAAVLRGLAPDEIAPAIGFLTASPRQGRVGIGWRGITVARGRPRRGADAHSVLDVDAALEPLSAADGAGSVAVATRRARARWRSARRRWSGTSSPA